jgi:hypothetical protein
VFKTTTTTTVYCIITQRVRGTDAEEEPVRACTCVCARARIITQYVCARTTTQSGRGTVAEEEPIRVAAAGGRRARAPRAAVRALCSQVRAHGVKNACFHRMAGYTADAS